MNEPIIEKSYQSYKYLHRLVKQWPKLERFTLGEKLIETTLICLEKSLEALLALPVVKFTLVHQVNTKVEVLKILTRLALDQDLINNNQYFYLQQQYQHLGRMSGGWLKSLKRND